MADAIGKTPKEQQHPQWSSDRQVVNQLLTGEPTDFNCAELARMMVRYRGFPGGRDIQADLAKTLKRWGYSEETLYEKTRQIHAREAIYTVRTNKKEDWN
jgi:Protein of unknown function (DUF3288)